MTKTYLNDVLIQIIQPRKVYVSRFKTQRIREKRLTRKSETIFFLIHRKFS